MTEISRFWTGRISQGALGDAGPYSSAQFATFLSRILDGAEQANRGVFRGVENELAVTPNSPTAKNVLVDTGAAVVQGRWYHNDSQATVTIAANVSGSTRIDLIVLEADYTAQEVRLAVEQGTPGAGQPAPQQIANTLWQIPIAYVTLASGYSTVTADMITDLREYANIPSALGIDVTSITSSVLEIGTPVIWAGNVIATSSTPGVKVAGVVERQIPGDGTGRIIVSGVVPVLCDSTVVFGDGLIQSDTTGQAQAGKGHNAFGFVLLGNSGAGTYCLALVHCFPQDIPSVRVYNSANISIPNATPTVLTFNSERYDTDSMHSGGSPSRLTCVTPGKYTITGNIQFDTGAITTILTILRNGATVIAGNSGGLYLTVSTEIDMVIGDYVELVATQSSGGAVNILASGSMLPAFSMHQSGN